MPRTNGGPRRAGPLVLTADIRKNARRPVGRRILRHDAAHPVHTIALLARRHRQGCRQRPRGGIEIIRIDDEGIPQLVRRTSQRTEDQSALFVVSGADVDSASAPRWSRLRTRRR